MQLLIKNSIKMGFTNRKFFTNQDFELLDGGLKITKKSLFEYFEFEIPYEHIANKKKIQSTINNNLFVIASSFLILGILFLLGTLAEISPALIIIGLIFFAITFIAKKQTVTIACFDGNTIELNYTNKNKSEIIEFADQIIESSNFFLLTKYSKIDKDLPIENQLNNLDFLRNREIISEEDFERLKDQLLGRNNKYQIGFSG
jgi:hypothetical protein